MTIAIIYKDTIVIEHQGSNNIYRLVEMLITSTHVQTAFKQLLKATRNFMVTSGFSILQWKYSSNLQEVLVRMWISYLIFSPI